MKSKYQIIYADPPWAYKDMTYSGGRNVIRHYPVMKLPQLKALPITNIAADNSALFLWVTMPKLDQCLEVIQAWGFVYKTVAFTWIKKNPKSGSLFWGMGRWTRSNAELCLLATRGSPSRISAAVHSVIEAPVSRHSQKPEEARDRIIRLMGDVPRIELFARTRARGWDAWGNEVKCDVRLAA